MNNETTPASSYTPNPSSRNAATLLWSAVVILTLLNICTLGFFWMQHRHAAAQHPAGPEMGPPPPGPGGRAFEFIVHEVQMTEAQRGSYEDLVLQHQQAMRPLRDRVRELRRLLFENLGKVEEQTLQGNLHELAQKQTQLDSVTVRHFQQVRALLTQEQQTRFDEIIGEVTRMMAAPPPPRRERAEGMERRDESGDRDAPPNDRNPDQGPPSREHHPPRPRP